VKSGQTIVLGGQVRDKNSRGRTKIPLLGDIPLLGRLFNSDRRSTERTETIVFITPYVLDTPDDVNRETKRRRDSLNIDGMWKEGWSGSKLAEPAAPERFSKPGGKPKPLAGSRASAPVPLAVQSTETWTSSDEKVARGGDEKDPSPEPAVVPVDPVSPVKPTPPARADESFEDADAFIIEQQQNWDEAMQGVR